MALKAHHDYCPEWNSAESLPVASTAKGELTGTIVLGGSAGASTICSNTAGDWMTSSTTDTPAKDIFLLSDKIVQINVNTKSYQLTEEFAHYH